MTWPWLTNLLARLFSRSEGATTRGPDPVTQDPAPPPRIPVTTVGGGAPTPDLGILADLPPSFTVLPAPLDRRLLLPGDYARAAADLGVDVPTIKAVAAVESRGSGFIPDGRPAILFEAHVFHRLTKGRFATRRDRYGVALSVPAWDRSLYGAAGAHQHDRLADAAALDVDAAIRAASWGMFQILGTNHAAVGYPTPRTFVAAASDGAGAHLTMFIGFVRANGLAGALRRQDWTAFARAYNGPAFAQNAYHTKLAQAYAREKAAAPALA